MKKVLTLAVLLIISVVSYSQKNMKAELKEASIYLKGAELIHKTSVQLLRGQNEITITGLSSYIEINSLKIKSTNGVIVSAFEFVNNPVSEKEMSVEAKQITDSIKEIDLKIAEQNTKYKINSDVKVLLEKGVSKTVYESEKGLPVDDITKTMTYFESKSQEVIKNMQDAQIKLKELDAEKNGLNIRYQQTTVKTEETTGSLKLTLTAPLNTTSALTISYYTPMAGWTPYYDINVVSTAKPVEIMSRAKVKQTTGMDWKDIKISLSTSVPSFGATAPLFSSWFLNTRVVPRGNYELSEVVVQNAFSYEKRSKNSESRSQDESPSGTYYIVNGQILDDTQFKQLDQTSIKSLVPVSNSDKANYGLSYNDYVTLVTFKSETDYVVQDETDLNIVYNIDIAYSVPGNGKEQSVDLKEQKAEAEYSYYTAPKLDKQTFLIAEIPDWQKLNLTSGEATITYDGTYIGKTYIDANSTSEKLTLTLGADNRVAVKRELMKDYSSTKFLGNNKLQVFIYKITVKNNQNKKVRIVTKDQYPLSTNKAYTVEFLSNETTKPTINKEDIGVITWEENFEPGETKVYKIAYSVKYPKDINLNL